MRNVAAILPLKSKLSGKFQRFNAINRCIEMLKIVEFSKISIKTQKSNRLKNFFQSPLIPPPPPPPSHKNKPYYVSETIFFKEIYRDILTFACKVVQKCSYWASRNRVVKIFFLTPQRNMFAGKFVKSERFLAVFREHIIFNVK